MNCDNGRRFQRLNFFFLCVSSSHDFSSYGPCASFVRFSLTCDLCRKLQVLQGEPPLDTVQELVLDKGPLLELDTGPVLVLDKGPVLVLVLVLDKGPVLVLVLDKGPEPVLVLDKGSELVLVLD